MVSRKPDVDEALSRLVGRILRQEGQAAGDCPDASILAAFYERALGPDEVARWEAHVAACERCQATLAALVRSEPAGGAGRAPADARWFAWSWRWLAPAAAVAVLAVWLALPDSARREAPAALVERAAQQPPVAEAPAQVEPPVAQREATARAEPPAPPPPTAAPSRSEEVARKEPARKASPAPAETAAAATGGVAAAPAREDRKRAEALAAAAPPVEALAERAAPARARQAPLEIASPDRASLWRVTPAGHVERSIDGGRTWIVQLAALPQPVLAGAAPARDICWLVGGAGLILRTANGDAWETLAAPVAEDLVRVEAQDAQTADVTTSGGTTYGTTDGGRTWTKRR